MVNCATQSSMTGVKGKLPPYSIGSVPFNLNQMGNRRHTGAVGTELYMSPEQVRSLCLSLVHLDGVGGIFYF